jgi:hypothetical protein
MTKRKANPMPGGRPRTYALNEAAFDDAASDPEAAYWVGFCMADSHISCDYKGPSGICLALSVKDEGHVYAFRDFLKSEHRVRIVDGPHSGYEGSGPLAVLAVYSVRLSRTIVKYGVAPGKKHRAEVFGLEASPDFWRGCVDGDGSVAVYRDKNGYDIPTVRLCGCPTLVRQFERFVKGIAPTCKATMQKATHVWEMRTSGRPAQAVLRALYGDCGIALPRKLALAKQALAWQYHNGRPAFPTFTEEELARAYAIHGSWPKVAKALGVNFYSLRKYRYLQRKQQVRKAKDSGLFP